MTVADSARAAGVAATRAVDAVGFTMTREQAAHFFEGWHEFYLLAGTAAVTLVGLLFVAL